MVAPTRTPQARGVKCSLCKKILAAATWLDQSKLAKNVEEAQNVLQYIKQHTKSQCPCIPKGIENLLVGSTHFEIHRLVAKRMDDAIHKAQYDCYIESRQKMIDEMARNQAKNINDCADTQTNSRFKIFAGYNDLKSSERSKQQLKHLSKAIDFWRIALEDQTHPFNSALALRLGLTHHVIYACYMFKYYKSLDYQLHSANLLLNLFRSIEGVTANAVLHANYLLVRTLMDCGQLNAAKHYLKQAVKMSNYNDKTHYESILLTCAACELNLLDGCGEKAEEDTYTILDDLASLAILQKDDKLQHYLARTYAISILIKYIHCYPARSDFCFEFYHAYRYICAIIRRCYESSFELVLAEKDTKRQVKQSTGQILDHSWIKFAVCDFVFSTFDLLSDFYMRTGQPENLELLYNGLNLISYRSGSCYWQTRMASIGASLDLLCDKYDHANAKVDTISRIVGHSSDPYIMNILRLDLEVSLIALLERRDNTVIKKDIILDILRRLKSCHSSMFELISAIELYDCKSNSIHKLTSNSNFDKTKELYIFGDNLSHLSLKALKIGTISMIKAGDHVAAKELISLLADQQDDIKVLTFYNSQMILETLLHFAGCHRSEQILLEAAMTSNIFLKAASGLESIESKLSMLTIDSDETAATTSRSTRSSKIKKKPSVATTYSSMGRRFKSKRKGTYDVRKSTENSFSNCQSVRVLDTIDAIKQFSSLTSEEIVFLYLRNSEPNPDYLLYRQAHELMFALRLKQLNEHQDISDDQLLYHFSESASANTMRYRWMMFEEQQVSPFDSTVSKHECDNHYLKLVKFSNVMTDPEKVLKTLVKNIPDDLRLLQMKYIIDKKAQTEHLLAIRYGNENSDDPIYIHAVKSIYANDFFEGNIPVSQLALPEKLSIKIEEAKKTLFSTNQRARTEARQRIERDVEIILSDIEEEWLGHLKFILSHEGGQLGLILDNKLEHVPFESLPIARVNKQGIFRVPSLKIFSAIVSRQMKSALSKHVDASETVFILDPANNLANTRERFEAKLKAQPSWIGCVGKTPQVEQLDEWLRTKQIYLFIGHGAGTTYYNQLCKGRGLSAMNQVRPMSIVMGCSSGRLQAEGPRLESFGISWVFILKGSPTYVGLLWDVTDTDIDRFLESLLMNWMDSKWKTNAVSCKSGDTKPRDRHKIMRPISEAVAWARLVCQYKFLVGSTPVVYGLPMWIK